MGLSSIIVPPPLKKGSTVFVFAPAGPSSKENLKKGLEKLSKLGYNVILGESVLSGMKSDVNYLAANDECRTKDLQNALENNNVDAIFITRGGFGTTRILHNINWDLNWKPKWVIGFSDFTAFSLALFHFKKWCSISGPVIASSFNAEETITWETFKNICHDQVNPTIIVDAYNFQISAKGVLLGGCLSMVCALMGTPYFPTFENVFLILEDVGEPMYKIDRMLTQLYHGGILNVVAGVIIGRWVNGNGEIDTDLNQQVLQRCIQLTSHRNIPIIFNFPYGHFHNRISVPLGSVVEYNEGNLKFYVS